MLELLSRPETWVAFFTLTALELVLGIDNIVFIAILADRLPEHRRDGVRKLGLALALILRLGLLSTLSWLMHLGGAALSVAGKAFSGRDLILLAGGLFLIAKATHEIHEKLEGAQGERRVRLMGSFGGVIVQIMLLDIVFSLDSVITAVGMAKEIGVMISAVVVAVVVMMVTAGRVSAFIEQHPTVKMLALSFLLLIGVTLVADGLDQHIPKGYIYFAMGFSVFVEMLNLRAKSKRPPVRLRARMGPQPNPKA